MAILLASALTASVLGPLSPSGAVPGDLTLVSITPEGVKGDEGSADYVLAYPSVSFDGENVAFQSSAQNLDSDEDWQELEGIYVKEIGSGQLTLASVDELGVRSYSGGGWSSHPAINANGSRVAFETNQDLWPEIHPPQMHVVVKDLTTGEILLASSAVDGTRANSGSQWASISADGSRVAFWSNASNLHPNDTESYPDLYVKDLTSGQVFLANTSDAGANGDGVYDCSGTGRPSISANGNKVAFASKDKNLDPSDTDTGCDIYVKDLITGDVVLASTSAAGVKGNYESANPGLSANGKVVAFTSSATNLDPSCQPYCNGPLWVKNLTTGEIVKVAGSNHYHSPLSADGSRVAFVAASTGDIVVKDLGTGTVTPASRTAAGVESNGFNYPPGMSADGTVVAFSTNATNLDSRDTDAVWDVYAKQLSPPPGSGAPTILSLNPSRGEVGTKVKIWGVGLGKVNSVKFNGIEASSFTVWSANEVEATVPFGATTGKITVRTPSRSASSPVSFVIEPTFADFQPTAGPVGTEILISGFAFHNAKQVTIGGTNALFFIEGYDSITATVPPAAKTGKVRVTTPTGVAESGVDFKVVPVIESFTPGGAPVGTAITIRGTGLGDAPKVKVSGIGAVIDSFTQGKIVFRLPNRAVTAPIVVITPGGSDRTREKLLVNPTVSGFSPEGGPPGTVVKVTGTGFDPGYTLVRFGDHPAAQYVGSTFVNRGHTELTVTVPNWSGPGPIQVSTYGGGDATTTVFKVLPKINSVLPEKGPVGTEVTIKGGGFNGVTQLKFNGTVSQFQFANQSPDQEQWLTTYVPNGATTGKISLESFYGTALSPFDFVVTQPSAPHSRQTR